MAMTREEVGKRVIATLVGAATTAVLSAFVPVVAQEERRLDIKWTSEGPLENPFRLIRGMVGAPDGSVYIVDPQAHTLYRFKPETGEYTWLNEEGEGPGELSSPTLVALAPLGDIAVYDIRRRMVLIYSPELEFRRQIGLGLTILNPKGFAYLSDGSFIITGSLSSTPLRDADFFGVQRFSGADGTRIGESVPLPDPGRAYRRSLGYVAGGPVWSLEEGGFLYSNSAPHRILHIDAGFNEREIASDASIVAPIVEKFLTRYVDEQRGPAIRPDWYHDQARGIFRLSNGRVLNIVTRSHSGTSTWELWAMGGELLERFDIGNAWRPFGITRDDDVLVSYYDDVSGEAVIAAVTWK